MKNHLISVISPIAIVSYFSLIAILPKALIFEYNSKQIYLSVLISITAHSLLFINLGLFLTRLPDFLSIIFINLNIVPITLYEFKCNTT